MRPRLILASMEASSARAEAREDFQFEKLQIVKLHMAGFPGNAPVLRFAADARDRFVTSIAGRKPLANNPASK